MTSRQRVLASLNHREPDRVPLDLSGHRSSGVAAMLYPKLRQALGLGPVPVRVYDPIQQLAMLDPDVLDRFGVDTIELGRGFAVEERWWADWQLPDGTPCQMPAWALPEREAGRWVLKSRSGRVIGQMTDGSLYFEQTHYPLAEDPGMALADALEECLWTAVPSPPGPAGPVGGAEAGGQDLAEGARALRRGTERAVIGLFGGNLLEIGEYLFRMDNFLGLLAGEPRQAHRFLDSLVEHHLRALERFLGAVGESIDVVVFGDDLGMQTGPLMSPAMYREFFQPRQRLLWGRAKQLSRAKVMLHSCGGIRQLLPDLIEAGLEAVNPVQITCAGMDAGELKREFGKDLVLWGGGCDTRHVLPQGSPAQVHWHVREQVRTLRSGGGFVFQQVHNIQANVPPENVVAMLEAVNAARGRAPSGGCH